MKASLIGVAPVVVGDRQAAFPATEGLRRADPPFAAPEIGQDVHIAPAAVAALGPVIEILPLAAIVDMAVDRGGPAQGAAAGGGDGAAAGELAGLGLVQPVQVGIEQGVDEPGRDMDEGMPVPRAASRTQTVTPWSSLRREASTLPADPRRRSHSRKFPCDDDCAASRGIRLRGFPLVKTTHPEEEVVFRLGPSPAPIRSLQIRVQELICRSPAGEVL